MGKIYVIASGKGGTGKTTITAALSSYFAIKQKRVLALDADIGARNLDIALGLSGKTVFDFFDILCGRCSIEKTLLFHPVLPSLHLLAAPQFLSDEFENIFTPKIVEQFKNLTDILNEKYDYIFIDGPAGIGPGLKLAAAGADASIIVATPDTAAVRDADQAVAALTGFGISHQRLIVNRVKPSLIRKGGCMNIDDVIDGVSIQLIGVIPDDPCVISAFNAGRILPLEKSPAAHAVINIAKRISGERVKPLQIR